ncbi:MAG: tetratricopeptide repeat protein, partial [Pseudomonadota bacterium]
KIPSGKKIEASMYCDCGNKKMDTKDYKGAVVCFTKAIELRPRYAEAYSLRGRAYSDLGQYDKAEQDLLVAIKYDEKLYKAHYNYARIKYARSEFDECIEHSEKAIKYNKDKPNDAFYYQNAICYYMKESFGAARSSLSEAIKINGNDPLYYCIRGCAYKWDGKGQEELNYDYAVELYNLAKKDFKKVEELDPKYACESSYCPN